MNFKELILVDKVVECPTIISFYFKSKDGSKLKKHKPGQFLPFKIKTDNPKYKDVMRTYSLSIAPNEHMYRISVKRVPNGLISSYLHEELKIGDSIEALDPAGIFISKESSRDIPMVLISGGIGVTPLLSMLYAESQIRNNIHFVQAVQNSIIQPFKKDIDCICSMKQIKNTTFFSNPIEEDKKGINYDEDGYVTKEWIRDNLPLNAEFYFCGPPPFMKGIETSLLELGVDESRINFELFS